MPLTPRTDWPALARVHTAISSASRGSPVGIDATVRQRMMRRKCTSDTSAVNANPDQVAVDG